MVLVLLFLVLLLGLLGLAYREMAAAIRVVSIESLQADRDQGSLQALALGVALLESGVPPASPYACGATIDTAAGPRTFRVTFTAQTANTWLVDSAPVPTGSSLPPMPGRFATSAPSLPP
jgi:hypothetical protein